MGENSEAPKPPQEITAGPQSPGRRSAFKAIAAVAGIWFGLGNKEASAQKKGDEIPKPVVAPVTVLAPEKAVVTAKTEVLQTPEKIAQFELRVKALADSARLLMPDGKEIIVLHNRPPETLLNSETLSSYGSVNGQGGLVELNIGKLTDQTLKYSLLLAGEAVAKVADKGNGGKAAQRMGDGYKKMTNSDLSVDAAKLDEFLDISNYVEGSKLKPDEDRLDPLKLTYYRAYAILRLEPDKLLEKLKKSPDAEKVANIFLSALSVTSGLNPEVNISKLGFDESLIKKLVVIGGNKIKIPLAA